MVIMPWLDPGDQPRELKERVLYSSGKGWLVPESERPADWRQRTRPKPIQPHEIDPTRGIGIGVKSQADLARTKAGQQVVNRNRKLLSNTKAPKARALKQKGLNQAEIAAHMSVSPQTIARLLRLPDHRPPSDVRGEVFDAG